VPFKMNREIQNTKEQSETGQYPQQRRINRLIIRIYAAPNPQKTNETDQ